MGRQFPASYPHWQQVTIPLLSGLSGTFSVAGSSTIVYALLRGIGDRSNATANAANATAATNSNKLQMDVKNRYLFGLCIADILNSLVFVFWSLPQPVDSPNTWGAIGNKQTCDLQGFMNQLGGMGSIYQGALSHYYYLSICMGMSQQDISAHRYEWRWNAVAVLFPLATATIGLVPLDSYAYGSNGCWFMPSPFGCQNNTGIACERGERAIMFAWLFMGVPLVVLQLVIGYHMLQIYRSIKTMCERVGQRIFPSMSSSAMNSPSSLTTSNVKSPLSTSASVGEENDSNTNNRTLSNTNSGLQQLPEAAQASIQQQQEQQRQQEQLSPLEERTRQAGIQAILYVLAYFVTHIWAFAVYHFDVFVAPVPFVIQALNQFFWPLQGFFNVFIFLRPRILAIQKKQPEASYWKALSLALFRFEEVVPQVGAAAPSRQALTRALR